MSNKKILITGATGAVGQEILRQLNSANQLSGVTVFSLGSSKNHKLLGEYKNEIDIFWGNISDKDQVKKACRGQDIVIHLAALIPPQSEVNPEMTTAVNLGGTQNIIAGMEASDTDGFLIYSSSISIYGDRLKNPNIQVSDPFEEEQHDHYANTKILAEKAIRESGLHWSVFRLTAIMGIGNHKVSGLMFDMPLETPMEIATVRDTARAFVHSIDKTNQLENKIFNLGGGPSCRISYLDFLTKAYDAFGMGKVNFPEYAFAKQNFHCGHYIDGDILEEILHFRQDDIDSYFERFRAGVPPIQRWATLPFAGIVKRYLLSLSKPYKAYKNKNVSQMEFYFGRDMI